MLTATASARGRGPNARPVDIAKTLRERYDPHNIHDAEEWLTVARQAVAMVTTARELMLAMPLPKEGEPDNTIR